MRINIELCVTSVKEALAAEQAGADGIEICSWLGCGGITPSSGLVDAIRTAVRLPSRILVRPGASGFVHDPADIHAILVDAEIFGGGGIGIVTGGLKADGAMDIDLIRSVKHVAPESELTFHRAIDHAPDPLRVLEQSIGSGVDRMLTSGGKDHAIEGADVLARLVRAAGADILIAAAGGIGPGNVVELVERTGVSEVHFSAQRPSSMRLQGAALSSDPNGMPFLMEPDVAKIEGVINALVKAGLR